MEDEQLDGADLDQLSAVLADVYDAALDHEIWHLALESACDFVDAGAGFLYLQDLAGLAGDACYAWGDDPDRRLSCFQAYARFNPAYAASPELPIGEVRAGSALLSPAEFRDSPFQAGWLAPQAYRDFATVVLERSNVTLTCLTFAAEEGHRCAEPPQMRRIGLLAPHFRRAVAIAEALGARRIQADALTEALDELSAGVILVSAHGAVVYANASGRALLEGAQLLQSRHDVLRAVDRKADATLRAALAGAAQAVPGGTSAPIRLPADDGDYLVHVLPLNTGQRRAAGVRWSAAAAVVVHRAALETGAALNVLKQLHDLTPGETRVLKAAVETAGTREMAEALGVAEATVNTHLRHLFEKTGVRRREELVKLVAAHSGPLRTSSSLQTP